MRISFDKELRKIIKDALAEDIGSGDLTSSIIPKNKTGKGYIVAGESFVLAGIGIAGEVFKMVDKTLRFTPLKKDGESVRKGMKLAEVSGSMRSMMIGERTALNFVQHLSGIATITHHHVKKLSGYKALLLDTRKTTPCLRILEKYATRVGGARNHRFGLYDKILVKSNHIDIMGGIRIVAEHLRKKYPENFTEAEIEVRTLSELREALTCGFRRILLDNMSRPQIQRAIEIAGGRAELEASGGINIKNIRAIASTGVDYISSGAITHSSSWVDISFKIEL